MAARQRLYFLRLKGPSSTGTQPPTSPSARENGGDPGAMLRAASMFGESRDTMDKAPKNKDPGRRIKPNFSASRSRVTGPSSSEDDITTEAESSEGEVSGRISTPAMANIMDGGDRSGGFISDLRKVEYNRWADRGKSYTISILRKPWKKKIGGWSNKEATDSEGEGNKGGNNSPASTPASQGTGASPSAQTSPGQGGSGGAAGSSGPPGGEDPPQPGTLPLPPDYIMDMDKRPKANQVSEFENFLKGLYGPKSNNEWRSAYEVSIYL